jgi:hypothetical protein
MLSVLGMGIFLAYGGVFSDLWGLRGVQGKRGVCAGSWLLGASDENLNLQK